MFCVPGLLSEVDQSHRFELSFTCFHPKKHVFLQDPGPALGKCETLEVSALDNAKDKASQVQTKAKETAQQAHLKAKEARMAISSHLDGVESVKRS